MDSRGEPDSRFKLRRCRDLESATRNSATYAQERGPEARYSPGVVLPVSTKARLGNPYMDKVSTSYVERQNLAMRMSMRRFTRLTNGFSKKVENHAASVAIHFMSYNFGRVHKSLAIQQDEGPGIQRTPAMAAGVTDHVWTPAEIVELAD